MIVLYSHNLHHDDVFQQVSASLSDNYDLHSHLLVSDDSASSEKRTNINFELALHERILPLEDFLSKYPGFDLNKAIFTCRHNYYFPRILSLRKKDLDQILIQIADLFSFFEFFLSSKKPTHIFSELIIGLEDAVLCHLSKFFGCKYVSIRAARMFQGSIFSDPYSELPIDFSMCERKKSDDSLIDNYLAQFSPNLPHVLPHYMRRSSLPISIFDVHFIKKLFYSLSDPRISFFKKSNLYILFKMRFRLFRLWNAFRLKHSLAKTIFTYPDISEKYFVFPLQYQPEATSSVRSFPFIDQVSLIKNIALRLPLGTYLYVKEHRGNEGYRSIDELLDIFYLPNVKLVDKNFDSNSLVSKSIGLFTLNSTLGFEALCQRKPVAAFGDGFWTKLSCVYRCCSFDDIQKFIDMSASFQLTGKHHAEIKAFVSSYKAHIRNFIFLSETRNFTTPENISRISSNIFSFVKCNK